MRNLVYARKVEILVSVLLLAMTFSPSLSFAADPVAEAEPAKVLTAVQIRMQQKVNVDFRETPIEDVLRMLAKQVAYCIVELLGRDASGLGKQRLQCCGASISAVPLSPRYCEKEKGSIFRISVRNNI